ncbi:MAG: hypothetical protein M3R68_05995, partial [Acidobacteriota bacterium]|nr:hypothetical protein [Acidobacteriota bacterium]
MIAPVKDPEGVPRQPGEGPKTKDQRPKTETIYPTAEEFSVLSPFERFSFRLVTRMNERRWKRFWTWCQRIFGAGWIYLSTYNLMNVYGLEHVE